MYIGSLKYYRVAKGILDAVNAALTNQVNRASVVPGDIAWDESNCGLLAVSIGQVFLSDNFPEPAETMIGGQCEAAWEVVQIFVQVVRCAPQPPVGELAPTTVAQDTAAQIMAQDTQQALSAIVLWICQNRDTNIVDGILVPVEPQGPEGDSVGVQFSALICLPRG